MAASLIAAPSQAQEMPKDFAYLGDVDPTIVQDMRYAGSHNFVGHKVPGYEAGECVLTRKAAEALKAVQADVSKQGFTLKVYDCYRPARAVKAFVAWAKLPDDPQAKAVYYPSLAKDSLFPGYIATVSGHSRGSTVDLTVVPKDAPAPSAAQPGQPEACTAPEGERSPDNSVDMGTSFDCFDVKANTFVGGLTGVQRENRAKLVEAMQRHGFKNYDKEWWHYTLANEPHPKTIFDFPILPRGSEGK